MFGFMHVHTAYTVKLDNQNLNSILNNNATDISRTFVSNNIVDNSDVVGASPVGAAPTTSLFST